MHKFFFRVEGSRESADIESKGELMNLSEIESFLDIHVAGNVGANLPTITCDQDGTVQRLFFLSSLIRRLVLHHLEQHVNDRFYLWKTP